MFECKITLPFWQYLPEAFQMMQGLLHCDENDLPESGRPGRVKSLSFDSTLCCSEFAIHLVRFKILIPNIRITNPDERVINFSRTPKATPQTAS